MSHMTQIHDIAKITCTASITLKTHLKLLQHRAKPKTPLAPPKPQRDIPNIKSIFHKDTFAQSLPSQAHTNLAPSQEPSDIPTSQILHITSTPPSTGKYTLSFQPHLFALPGISPTPQYQATTLSLPEIINKILKTPSTPIQPNPWTFEMSTRAATANSMRLLELNFDMETATQQPQNTILTYGSEFRHINVIAPILQHHPNWNLIKDIITKGASYPLRDISEKDRLEDITFHLDRGNHQSSILKENKLALFKSFKKEVDNQWAIPLTPSIIKLIPGASITPLGVAVQWSINARGERILKRRTTHDCSFPGPSGESCNLRVHKEDIPACQFGHALRRFLHGLSDIRRRHPNTPILITKTDMDSAYRRVHAAMQAAVTCITVLMEIAYLLTRLPFGSAPAPALFSIISDSTTDLAFDLSLDPTWDTSSLQSSFPFLDPKPTMEPSSISFGKADPLIVKLPPRNIVADNFIDDIFMAGVAIGDIPLRLTHAVPIALECLFKPPSSQDATKRTDIINKIKHLAEGLPSEVKIVLGWQINTRSFRVHLTTSKRDDWQHDINLSLMHKQCSKGTLESMIGRFNHVGTIIHTARYFLTRLRYRLNQYQHNNKKCMIKLAPWDINDLKLWHHHIEHVHNVGVSINNICLSKPSATTYSDACEWGLGGFTTQGNAWRFQLPPDLHHRASINLLEFMAAIITIQLSLDHDDHHTEHKHILAFTDNSSALGWMYHSTFNPIENPQHDTTARYLAMLLLDAEASLHSEHIPGVHNEIADSLSRDFHLNDSQILHLLSSSQDTTSKVPPKLQLLPPPLKTISWIVSILQSMTPTKPLPAQQSPSTIAASFYSSNSWKNAASMTTFWTNTTPTKSHLSCVASPTASELTTTNPLQRLDWQAAQSQPPSQTWFRPSGRTYGPIPPSTTLEQNPPSSPTRLKGTKMKTPPQNIKHVFPS